MCLCVLGAVWGNIDPTKAKVARRDIITFKRVYKKKRGLEYLKDKFRSLHFSFTYTLGYHYSNDNFPMETHNVSLSDQGMHSFDLKRLSQYQYTIKFKRGSYALIKCIIPKGTPYYRGTSDEIISRELIVEKVITDYEYRKLLGKK